ncbi:MAG: carbamoyltransferase N-terminal domain-containing protein, partial [Myxococcota bacterium]
MKPQYIIGVHDGHNAAAAVVKDGQLQFAIQEERLVGVKNFYGFPENSIRACLAHCAIEPSDVAELAFVTMRRTPRRFQTRSQRDAVARESSAAGTLRRLLLWYPIYRVAGNMGWSERLESAAAMGFARDRCQRY